MDDPKRNNKTSPIDDDLLFLTIMFVPNTVY